MGQVAYMLDLPSSSRVHLVVHVSLLRSFHGEATDPEPHPLSPQDLQALFSDVYVSHSSPQSLTNKASTVIGNLLEENKGTVFAKKDG